MLATTIPQKLDDRQRQAALSELSGWTLDGSRDAIVRQFKFANFRDAFAFMTRVALASEARRHHPEWCNTYNRVTVTLTTHDAGGLSVLDIELAREINLAYACWNPPA